MLVSRFGSSEFAAASEMLTNVLETADVNLSSLSAASDSPQWLLLLFIPMAWTFVCPTEIIAFSDSFKDFQSRGCNVAFASTDSEYSLHSWSTTSRKMGGLGDIKVPLISDKNHRMSRDYGVLIEDEGIALRGMFLIDPNRVVRHVTCSTHVWFRQS
jgi:peroxiredoxin (alkyl hydroperoxide reductase subunit C)